MKTSIVAGLTKDEKANVIGAYQASLAFRKQLQDILTKKIESGRKKTSSVELYSSPNWGYEQADHIGYERALREMISLITD